MVTTRRGGVGYLGVSGPDARDEAVEVGSASPSGRIEGPNDRVGARDRDRVAEEIIIRGGGIDNFAGRCTRRARGIERPSAPDEAVEIDGTSGVVCTTRADDRVGTRDRDRDAELILSRRDGVRNCRTCHVPRRVNTQRITSVPIEYVNDHLVPWSGIEHYRGNEASCGVAHHKTRVGADLTSVKSGQRERRSATTRHHVRQRNTDTKIPSAHRS